MIKRHHIRQFLGVADAGSFVQAAARLHITQPSLSAGIAELERLVGTRLFVRNRRLVRLTEAGGAFLPIARDLERGFRAADSFGRGSTPDWPTLRLGAIRTVAPGLLRAVIAPLRDAYGVELVEGSDQELRVLLAGGRIAAALTLLRPGEHGATVHGLWEEPYRMFVPAGHPLTRAGTVAPEDLASAIMIARRACEVLDDTSRFFTAAGVRPRFALRSDSDERCMAMVAAGLGITTAPLSLAVAGTVPIDVAGYTFRRRVGLLCDPGFGHDLIARGLLPVIAAGVRGEGAVAD
ncbi:LysR family transcriptional regulator [Novosphingobium sp.]|uniref:LysR family transcriptional regulator n=1 Tax=Novosphingobium sp. TaxID=1874826 RepID=UPI0033424ADE